MADLQAGHVLAERFEIVGILGRGGMATVYLAHDRLRGERVALKVLHPHLADDPSMRARLRREVLAAARLRHPGALVANELHELDGTWALSLPYHPGRTLSEWVTEEGPLGADDLRRLGTRLAEVLAEAHRQGILHRDVTPNNVMMGARGEPMLTDFGLARLQDSRSTRGTSMLGTSGYTAPEIFTGGRAEPRSDLYGLGALLYFAATGRQAFPGDNPVTVLKRQMDGDVTPLQELRADLPQDLPRTIHSLLHQDPSQRPQGAADLAEALKQRSSPEVHPISDTQAEGPPPATPPPRQGDALEPRPHLPRGHWVVVVREKARDKNRRNRLRAAHGVGPFRQGDELRRLVVHLRDTVFSAIGVPDALTPERRLSVAVAREANLPPQALHLSQALYHPQFRLVDDVAESTARGLSRSVQDAGFEAALRDYQRHPSSATRRQGSALGPLMLILIGAVMLAGPVGFLLVGMGILLLLRHVWRMTRQEQRALPWEKQLPLAYGQDLRPMLTAGHEHLLPAPVMDAAPPASDTAAATTRRRRLPTSASAAGSNGSNAWRPRGRARSPRGSATIRLGSHRPPRADRSCF